MKSYRFEFESLIVDVSPKRLVVSGRWPWAPHLTLFSDPRPAGRWAGRWTPHLTFGRRARRRLGALSRETMKRFSEGVSQDLGACWLDSTTPVDLAELSRDGWMVHAPIDAQAVLARAERIFGVGDRRYRLTDARLERFGEEAFNDALADCVDPVQLAHQKNRDQPFVAMRASDDQIELCWISARWTPEDGRGEWQCTSWDWLPRERAIEIYLRHAGAGFPAALAKIARALRLEDPDFAS